MSIIHQLPQEEDGQLLDEMLERGSLEHNPPQVDILPEQLQRSITPMTIKINTIKPRISPAPMIIGVCGCAIMVNQDFFMLFLAKQKNGP